MNYDEVVLRYLTDTEAALDAVLYVDPAEHSEVLEAMRYSTLSGGKRVRAVLALAACELVSGADTAALPAAAAIEMIHAYSLIHDDLPCMDDDAMRRGKPACHIAFGEATALLAGDALQSAAFAALGTMRDAEKGLRCVTELAEAAGHRGMVLGQELDLAAAGGRLTPAQLTRIHRYKTGALILAALRMGGIAGGADERQLQALSEYGRCVGLVFQLVDDVLNRTATEEEMGKPVGNDEEQQKVTGASLYGISESMALAAQLTATGIAALDTEFECADFLIEFAKKLLTRKK